MRTAESIAQNEAMEATEETAGNTTPRKQPKDGTLRLAPYRWPKGKSGNPKGRPKDVAQTISRAVFERNTAKVYEAMGRSVLKGNAYSFSVLADRAYGKVKETRELINGGNGQPFAAAIQINLVQVSPNETRTDTSELPGQISVPVPTE